MASRSVLISLLLKRIISYAKSRGLKEIYGSVLAENKVMIEMCKKAGFSVTTNFHEPGTVVVKLLLNS